MKKFFTLCAFLLVGCIVMNAQSFAFVDDEGNVIENGTTLIYDEVETNPSLGPLISLKNVSIKNLLEVQDDCKITFKVEKLPAGSTFTTCDSGSCLLIDEGGSFSFTQPLNSGVVFQLAETKWLTKGVEGTCTVKIAIQAAKSMMQDSEITVNFVNESTDINNIYDNETNKVVARYSINGQILDTPQKGINILKYADGRIEKVIVK